MSETSISASMLESMMIRLLHNHEVFLESYNLIEVTQFLLPQEHQFAVLWQAMREAYGQRGSLDYYTLRDYIQWVAWRTPHIDPARVDYLIREGDPPGFLQLAFSTPSNYFHPDDTRRFVRGFLEERAAWRVLQQALASRHLATQPGRLQELFSATAAKLDQISRVSVNPVSSAWPTVFNDETVHVESTGLPYMDKWMDGGDSPGEVNGLLGPMGVGKTTLGCNLAVAKARVAEQAARLGGRPPKIVYFMSYEQPEVEIRKRLWCCAGRVVSSSFNFNDFGRLSHSALKNFNGYEIAEHNRAYGDNAAMVPMLGEYERLLTQQNLLQNGIRIVDLSGMGKDCLPGVGFVSEMSSLIEADQRRLGNPGVANVIVDYTLLAVQRYMADRKIDEGKMRHVIRQFVDETRQRVAGRFNTTAWLLHQLNSQGNSGSPTKATTHMQAAEGVAFAAFLTFCASIGTKDEKSSCVLLKFSKRRRAGEYIANQILHLKGAMQVIEDGNDDFVIDEAQGRILPKHEHRQIHGDTGTEAVNTILDSRPVSAGANF